MIRRTRAGTGIRPVSAEPQLKVEVFHPTHGIDSSSAPQGLKPGFSPHAYNWVPTQGHIAPRSGLSCFAGNTGINDYALGAWRMNDLEGGQHGVVASCKTLSMLTSYATNLAPFGWSTLSYQKPSTSSDNLPSGTTRDYWQAAVVYDPVSDRNIMALANGKDLPKVITLTDSVQTFSDMTGFASLASRAKAVAAFDNRLVWLNIGESAATYPQRVLWSPRGLPHNYQLADGAGFEDLLDMQGVGTKIVAEKDGILIFSEEEIWRGRKRFDAYAFDFYPVERKFGCPYPNTIAVTPIGVVFLARDLELYTVRGDQVIALGPADSEADASRIQPLLENEMVEAERAFAVYNTTDRRYELYYPASGDAGNKYPQRAIFYGIAERSYFPQQLATEVSAGFEMRDPGDLGPTWEQLASLTWEDMARSWDDLADPGVGYMVHLVSSAGTSYRLHEGHPTDDGSMITAVWRSSGLNNPQDQMNYDRLSEVFVEYSQGANAQLGLYGTPDLGDTFPSGMTITLPSNRGRATFPVNVEGVAPGFELRVTDGTKPRIARIQAVLRPGGRY